MENENVLSIHEEYHKLSIVEEDFEVYCRNIWLILLTMENDPSF